MVIFASSWFLLVGLYIFPFISYLLSDGNLSSNMYFLWSKQILYGIFAYRFNSMPSHMVFANIYMLSIVNCTKKKGSKKKKKRRKTTESNRRALDSDIGRWTMKGRRAYYKVQKEKCCINFNWHCKIYTYQAASKSASEFVFMGNAVQ